MSEGALRDLRSDQIVNTTRMHMHPLRHPWHEAIHLERESNCVLVQAQGSVDSHGRSDLIGRGAHPQRILQVEPKNTNYYMYTAFILSAKDSEVTKFRCTKRTTAEKQRP
jgi:hypothetical protein